MNSVSNEYSLSMKRPLRNHSYFTVNIGLINQQAQTESYIENQDGFYLSDYDIFGTKKRSFYYATFEQDFVKADGKTLFPPREAPINMANGYISSGLISQGSQFILIKFSDVPYVNVKGLTLTFGDFYPTDFIIETDNNTIEVSENKDKVYTTDQIFENATYFKITAMAMKNQNMRFRIQNVTFGIGVFFDNRNIKKLSLKSFVSLISANVPQQDFSLTVDNTGKTYNIENEDSTINFFESGQSIFVQYGYELDSGKVEWFKLATAKLKSWDADDTAANFTAVDPLENLSDIYYKGVYSEEGVSLYDLAVQVFEDAGLTTLDYEIDEYLKTIITHNPLPKVKHKECIQLIANAGRCILTINSDGKIVLKSSFIPDMVAQSENQHYLSNVAGITNLEQKIKYATFEKNTAKLKGMVFAPRSKGSNNTGYISSSVSNAEGLFEVNPSIELTLEAAFICFGLTFEFDGNCPSEFNVKTYRSDTLIEEFNVKEVSKSKYILKHGFLKFDKVIFTFTKTSVPFNRVKINSILFGEITDYKIEYRDLKATPKGIKLNKVRDVNVVKTEYSYSTEASKQLYKGNQMLNAANSKVKLEFMAPVHDVEVNTTGYENTILSSGAFYVEFEVSGLPDGNVTVPVSVMGKQFLKSEVTYSKVINTSGITKTLSNPLISTENAALDALNWVSDYYYSDKEYELNYRGDPALDAGDIFYLENEFNPNLMCKLYDHDLSFNGSISGRIKARREVNV